MFSFPLGWPGSDEAGPDTRVPPCTFPHGRCRISRADPSLGSPASRMPASRPTQPPSEVKFQSIFPYAYGTVYSQAVMALH